MKKMKKKVFILVLITLFFSCKTLDLEQKHIHEKAVMSESMKDTRSEEEILIDKIMKENDIEQSVVYVAPPEMVKHEQNEKVVTGKNAVKENLKENLVEPEYEGNLLRAFRFSEDSVFEIHCQTHHITDIELELGEQLTDDPFIADLSQWEVGTGTRIINGEKQIHLILKPSRTGLSSTMVIMSDRRVYHCEILSCADHFMPVVRWVYPKKLEFNLATLKSKNGAKLYTELGEVETEFLSFDYTMKHSAIRRPSWLPKTVYDDGRRTYFVLDELTLFTKMPALFDKSRNLINYRVKKNVLIVDQLIDKVTLRIGREKVTIIKKKTKGDEQIEMKRQEKSDELDKKIVDLSSSADGRMSSSQTAESVTPTNRF